MAQNFYGINDVELVKVTGLDIIGNDAEKMISDKISEIRQS